MSDSDSKTQTMIDRILELHSLMTEIVLSCTVGAGLWEKLIHNPEKWGDRRTVFVLTFLEKLYRDEWKKILDYKTQFCATPEMWENMEMFDEDTFPEMLKLKEKQKNLKARWVAFKDEYRDLLKDLRS